MSAKKFTFTMKRGAANWLADLGLSASSSDDITPVLCGALIEVDGTTARVTCTDRYRAHTGIVELEGKAKSHSVLVPRTGLLWLKKNYAFHGRFMPDLNRVTITTVFNDDATKPNTVAIAVTENNLPGAGFVTWTGEVVKGNFPAVRKLIDEARDAEAMPATARINLNFLSKAKVLSSQSEPVRVKFTASSNPNKPGPIYLAWDGFDGLTRAEGIIQPHVEVSA